MEIATLVNVLDHPHQAADQLHAWGLSKVHQAQRTLLELADSGLTLDLLAALCEQLGQHLPQLLDPDAALESLRRFLLAARSPLAVAALFERDRSALPHLLHAVSLGPTWRNLLVSDPEAFDVLRQTEGLPQSREAMLGEIAAEVATFADDRAVMAALVRVKKRDLLRIAYGDVFGRLSLTQVTEQLTWLAEAIVAAALRAAAANIQQHEAVTKRMGRGPQRVAVIALGRLGGGEMDYSSDIELLLVHHGAAGSEAARRANYEHGERLAKLLMKYLSEANGTGPVYRVRLAPLPDSQSPLLIHSADDTVLGFDSFGRTWHRQAMLRARPIAGELALADDVLWRLESWIYRRYLNRADETGIKALRRRLLRRTAADVEPGDPTHSCGGLLDIEGVVQFLQLLVGGDQPLVREQGTLAAMAGLEQAGALSVEERSLLENNYLWLRQVAQRIQVLLGHEITQLPADQTQLSQLAQMLNGGHEDLARRCRERLAQSWQVLSRLLAAALTDDEAPPVVELLLDPTPSGDEAAAALDGYGFANPLAAATALHDLASERIPFLSTRRCRHFLSLIVERLLQAIGGTPDPDATLANLCRVSDSLGGKGVLWELLSFHPPSLALYVRLCAASPYLSDILTTNPGMIDDLVDSLQLDRLPSRSELVATLAELSRGTGDVLSVLHDLKNSAHLRIGVRDILGKDSIEATHAALADVAELCLAQLVEREFAQLVLKHGRPTIGPGPFEGEPCRLAILGLGKLGAREPNYHSNVEVAFLYEAEGTTRPAPRSRQQPTANNHFFTQLAQRVLKEASQLTPKGRLYTIDVVLRPIGIGGAMALSLDDFAQHFLSAAAPSGSTSTAPLWQWQALCQARPVAGDEPLCTALANLVRQLLASRPWRDEDRAEIYRARLAQERGAAELNLKRGRGGTLDIEFLAQMLQLAHAASTPAVLVPGTQAALAALAAAGHLSPDDAQYLSESYRFLRRIESGLRLLNTPARHDLPDDRLELDKLALLLGQPNGDTIRDRTIMTLAENRRRFERIVGPPP